ncbi:MAG: ATPase, partial [Desulfuromonadaceae bacterium]|nr:ATPase [Desulfuromonadaceae bacterium]
MIILGEKLLKEKTITQEQLDQGLERQRRHGGRLGRNLVELGYIKEQDIKRLFEKHPPVPKSIEDTGIDLSFITDLVSKHILFMGEFKLADVVDKVKLPISLINRVLEVLRREKL